MSIGKLEDALLYCITMDTEAAVTIISKATHTKKNDESNSSGSKEIGM